MLASRMEEIARQLGLDPRRPVPPEPGSVLATALAVHERAQREEALGGLMMDGSRAIYRESGRRRR